MKPILCKRIERKYRRRQALKKFWFSLFKLRRMRKRIEKLYYKEQLQHDTTIYKLTVYAHAFKYSKPQIEYGLNLLVEKNVIESFEPIKKGDSKDGYTLVFSSQNRSQDRILAEVPEEIDLNQVNVEPVRQLTTSEQTNTAQKQSTASSAEEPTVTQPF